MLRAIGELLGWMVKKCAWFLCAIIIALWVVMTEAIDSILREDKKEENK